VSHNRNLYLEPFSPNSLLFSPADRATKVSQYTKFALRRKWKLPLVRLPGGFEHSAEKRPGTAAPGRKPLPGKPDA
jgi:hypothetical protein